MSIINEQFIMTNVTSEQYKSYFYELPPALSNGATTNINIQPSQSIITNVPIEPSQSNSIQQQELMIREFSAKSNLNIEWSKQ